MVCLCARGKERKRALVCVCDSQSPHRSSRFVCSELPAPPSLAPGAAAVAAAAAAVLVVLLAADCTSRRSLALSPTDTPERGAERAAVESAAAASLLSLLY